MKTHLLASALLFATAVTAHAQLYLFKDLGSTYTYTYFDVSGINNKGEIVGTAYDGGGRPVMYHHNGFSFSMAASPGPAHSSWGHAINAAGTIAGFCDRDGATYHAMFSVVDGPSVDLDTDWSRDSDIVAINDSNYVVGQAGGKPYLGNTTGWMTLMDAVLGATYVPTDINNKRVIVGNGPWGGMTYNVSTGVRTYLGYALGSWSSRAQVINESGVVAGVKGTQGFVYQSGAVTYFGSNVADVTGINLAGDVVGVTTTGRAFVYLRASHTFADLNSRVFSSISSTWEIIDAGGINDDGVIAVQARRPATPADGEGSGTHVYRAVKLTPFRFLLPFFPASS